MIVFNFKIIQIWNFDWLTHLNNSSIKFERRKTVVRSLQLHINGKRLSVDQRLETPIQNVVRRHRCINNLVGTGSDDFSVQMNLFVTGNGCQDVGCDVISVLQPVDVVHLAAGDDHGVAAERTQIVTDLNF